MKKKRYINKYIYIYKMKQVWRVKPNLIELTLKIESTHKETIDSSGTRKEKNISG